MPSFLRAQTFQDVVVYPTQQLLSPPLLLFRGGPDWPQFWLRRAARHCRFKPAVPLDVRPARRGALSSTVEPNGVWCGPVTQHFGHAVATFGSRLAAASISNDLGPMVFSALPGERPPSFFWQILTHFGVSPSRVRIVTAPTRSRSLSVMPQAELLHGGAPDQAYLELLTKTSGVPQACTSKFYISRAGLWKGKVAGEAYLETVLARCGFKPFRPEDHSLYSQLAVYRDAAHLIFAEGSALHGLQLLGRIPARITIIARRQKSRLGHVQLAARAAPIAYVDAVRALISGVNRTGRSQPSAGMTLLDAALLVAGLEREGIAIARHWDDGEFAARQHLDLMRWLDARKRNPTHPRDAVAIDASLRRFGLAEGPSRPGVRCPKRDDQAHVEEGGRPSLPG